tara:strand:+ start:252 stop:1541 length:1290 start_codon:yes stop_codon:yes gene_type:complete
MKAESNFTLNSLIIGVDGQDRSIDIKKVLSLVYIEDIKSASVQVFISLTDTAEGELSRLVGMEPVFLNYEDADKNNGFNGNLMVFDVQNREISNNQSKVTICCCNPDLINNAAAKISRRFGAGGGKTIDKIVKEDILEGILGTTNDIDARKTKNTFSFVSPYWSPFTMINYLASKSIPAKSKSSENASAGYAFYENANGYHFRSYDSFCDDKFTFKVIVGYESPKEAEPEPDIIEVSTMNVAETGDVLMGLNIGSFNSKVMTFDMKDMGYQEYDFNIHKYYDSVPKLNGDVKLPKYFEKFKKNTVPTRIMSKVIDTALYTEGTFTQDITKLLSQSSLREKLFYNKKVEISFTGTLAPKVGDLVELSSFTGKTRELDTANSGIYVIGRIEREYIASTDRMTTNMVLYTDSAGDVETTTQTFDANSNKLVK